MNDLTIVNNRYKIVGKIGEGGMGTVYKVSDILKENRIFALKTIKTNSTNSDILLARFRQEFEIMTRLNHPNLVRVYDFGQDNEIFFFVMDFVEGITIRKILKDNILLDTGKTLEIIIPLLRALEFIQL